MTLGDPIQIRLTLEKQALFEQQAALNNKPLATYLREKLEADHELHTELTKIRRAIQRQQTETDMNLLLEILLLLRAIAGADRMSLVDAEMRRNGFQPWTPKT